MRTIATRRDEIRPTEFGYVFLLAGWIARQMRKAIRKGNVKPVRQPKPPELYSPGRNQGELP